MEMIFIVLIWAVRLHLPHPHPQPHPDPHRQPQPLDATMPRLKVVNIYGLRLNKQTNKQIKYQNETVYPRTHIAYKPPAQIRDRRDILSLLMNLK